MAEIKLIKMIRPFADAEPKEADVHPSMVEDYRQGGWIPADTYDVQPEPVVEDEPEAPKRVTRKK